MEHMREEEGNLDHTSCEAEMEKYLFGGWGEEVGVQPVSKERKMRPERGTSVEEPFPAVAVMMGKGL